MRIEPIAFDPGLVAAARAACAASSPGEPASSPAARSTTPPRSRRVLPAAMVFAPSIAGISHAREEDTPEADLAVAIEAFGALAERLIERGS